MKLSILVTTMNEDINKVLQELVPQIKKSEVIISHQITDGSKPLKKIPKGVKYYYMYEKGLSKNRNNALKHATGDVCVVCDDDVRFLEGFEDVIINSYKKNLSAEVITFKSINLQGKERKKYSNKIFQHSLVSILSVSSIEITFKRKSVLGNEISFDENFGLGAKYSSGEENIFLSDCKKKGLDLYFVPEIINKHPQKSSGISYSKNRIETNIKVFKRIFGFLGGLFAFFYFWTFHHKYYKNKITFIEYLKIGIRNLF